MAQNKYVINALISLNKQFQAKDAIIKSAEDISNLDIKNMVNSPVSLPKCKYQTSIYTALKSIFENDDYYLWIKQFFGTQPLEKLSKDIKDYEKIETQCDVELDGTKTCLNQQPYLYFIQEGITDFQDFTADFYKNNVNISCKEGFADLALAKFAKYNNPTIFNILRNIFIDSSNTCEAYELQEICSPMPIGLDDLHMEIIKAAPEIATSFTIYHP